MWNNRFWYILFQWFRKYTRPGIWNIFCSFFPTTNQGIEINVLFSQYTYSRWVTDAEILYIDWILAHKP